MKKHKTTAKKIFGLLMATMMVLPLFPTIHMQALNNGTNYAPANGIVAFAPMAEPIEQGAIITPKTVTLEQGDTFQFEAAVPDSQNSEVIWSVEGGKAGTTISNTGLLTIAADEAPGVELAVKAASVNDPEKYATAVVTVEGELVQGIVTGVTVAPTAANVARGATRQFTAAVQGTNTPSQAVTWSIAGGKIGTTISPAGVLTVAADEAVGTSLIVIATSVQDNTKSGTATATITDVALAAPTTADNQRDVNRLILRVNQALLTAANYTRWVSDYEGADALSIWYTDDGSEPNNTGNGERLRINPAVSATGALAAPRAYVLDYTGGTTYKFIAYNGNQASEVTAYTTPMHSPRLAIDNNIDPAATNNTLRLTSGLYKKSDLSGGIGLFSDSDGAAIYYQTAATTWNAEKSQFEASAVDGLTPAQLIENGEVFDGDISAAALNETNAIAIRATAVRDGIAPSAAVTYQIRAIDDADFIALAADENGNLAVDIDDFIAQLTAEEKLMLLGGVGGDPIWLQNGYNYPIESNNDGILRTGGPAGGTPPIPRFNIPSLALADGPAGVRMWKNATIWMAPAGIGATWNAALAERVGARYAAEAKHYAIDVVLGPGINNQRNPISGRNFEYYSEDPYILGLTAASQVRGMQDGGVAATLKHFAANDYESGRSNSAYATERSLREIYLRAFEIAVEKGDPWAVMTGYNGINSIATARNPWLTTDVLRGDWGFKGFVMTDWSSDARVESIEAQTDMTQNTPRTLATYLAWLNDPVNGERNIGYLDRSVKNVLGVLVKTFAFQGEYGVLQPDGTYADGENLSGEFREGLTSEDIGVRNASFGSSEVRKESSAVNKEVADEAIVLLRNEENTLPLNGGESIALVTSRKAWQEYFNPRWYGDSASVGDVVLQGTGSAQVRFNNSTDEDYAMTLVEALEDRGFDVAQQIDFGILGGNNQDFLDAYNDNPPKQGGKKYIFSEELSKAATAELAAYNAANAVPLDEAKANAQAAAEEAADNNDVGIFVLSRISGESQDVSPALFNIEPKELVVYEAYEKAFRDADKPFIVLLNVGGTTSTTAFRGGKVDAKLEITGGWPPTVISSEEYSTTTQGADAILDVWNPGSAGTEAIADILNGTVNPSGKLAQTFPVNFDDSPSVELFNEHNEAYPDAIYPGNGYNNAAYYADGVYVGYRFYESRPEAYEEMVAYPFGYGLSYTTFEFSDFELNKTSFDDSDPDDVITATVKVTNTGDAAGKEVVQLYLGASTWQEEGRPKNELRAYGKTSLLEPGESETVTLSIVRDDLLYFDDENPEGLIPTDYSASNPPVYKTEDAWTVADGTVFTATIRTNAENAGKPNVPISGLTKTFIYGGETETRVAIEKSGDDVTADFEINNPSASALKALCVIAVYAENGALVSIEVQNVTIDAGGGLSESITIPFDGADAKAFIWHAETMAPLCAAADLAD